MWGHVNKKGASAYLLQTPLFICPSFHQLHNRARSSKKRGGISQKHILGEILSHFPVSCKFLVVGAGCRLTKAKIGDLLPLYFQDSNTNINIKILDKFSELISTLISVQTPVMNIHI